MDPELQKLEASFNKKIEEWISKQGLIFQFTHYTGSGSIIPKIYGLILRLFILGVIALAGFWFYLSSLPNSTAFKLDVQQQLEVGLNASDVKISHIIRGKGGLLSSEMLIAALSLGETESSFFENWYVTEEEVSTVGRRSVENKIRISRLESINLSPFEIGDNYFSGWSGKELKIQKIEMKLKTGAETDDLTKKAYSSLFKEYKTLKINNIQVFDANLLWGYSEMTAGSIKGAQLDIVKGIDSWEINVTGGTFSHSWLKNASIKKMKVICKKSDEVVIESATFGIGGGELSLKASIQIKSQPEIKGNFTFQDIDVIDLIGKNYENRFGGNIDGHGELAGTLSSGDGVKTTTTVMLRGSSNLQSNFNLKNNSQNIINDSVLVLRGGNFQLLKTMQSIDPRNSYSLLRANQGKITIENQGRHTHLKVEGVRCGSNDLILMNGEFDYAPRQNKSKKKITVLSTLEQQDSEAIISENPRENELAFNESSIVKVFSGELKLGILTEAFENNAKILEVYPVDSDTLRVWFNVSLDGQLQELTNELADKLFDIMQASKNN